MWRIARMRNCSVILVPLALVGAPAQAYEMETHQRLTEEAFSQSSLSHPSESPLLDLGVEDLMQPQFYSQPPSGQRRLRNARTVMGVGAMLEDEPVLRVLNHFFDPQLGGIGLIEKVPAGLNSPTWALEDSIDVSLQDFSLRVGREHHWKAIAEKLPADRTSNIGALLEILGRVSHHLQDMAQPAHTRNDDHLPLEKDMYETFTNNEFKSGKEMPLTSPYGGSGVDLRKFGTARSFWQNNGMGIAEFSSNNFVSRHTNFRRIAGVYLPDSLHGLPVPHRVVPVPVNERSDSPGRQDHITNLVDDKLLGVKFENDRASTYSLFEPDIALQLPDPPFTAPIFKVTATSLNSINFRRNHEILLPRAIAYSAGFINYYFRGRLKIDQIEVDDEKDIVKVTIRNRSAADFSFEPGSTDRGFALFYDRLDSKREPLVFLDALPRSKWPYDEAREFSFKIPIDVDVYKEKQFVLAFDGMIGKERGIAAVAFGINFKGLVAKPNYSTTDGDSRSRVLSYRSKKWVARTEDAQAGTIDWKGEKPGDVLTWGTSRLRYDAPNGDTVYMNGKALTRGPRTSFGPIAGASIRYVNGERTLNVAKAEPDGLRVYSRKFAESYDNEDAWSVNNPLGWRLVFAGGDTALFTGVFFNALGSSAQYLVVNGDSSKTRVKISLQGDRGESSRFPASAQIDRTDRYLRVKAGDVEVTHGTCTVESPFRDGVYTEGAPPCGLTAHSGYMSDVDIHTLTDSYREKTIFCVDYRGNEEVFCEIEAPQNPTIYGRTYTHTVEEDYSVLKLHYCAHPDAKDDFKFNSTFDETIGGARVVRIGAARIPWSAYTSSSSQRRSAEGSWLSDYDGSGSTNDKRTSQSTALILADARYDFVVFDSRTVEFGGSQSTTFTRRTSESWTGESYIVERREVVAMHAGQRHVLFSEDKPLEKTPVSFEVNSDEHGVAAWTSCSPAKFQNDQPTTTTLTDPEGVKLGYFSGLRSAPGSAVIDSAGRLALSQLIASAQNPQSNHGYRNILTDGDLPSLIPGTPTADGYSYDFRLLR